MSAGYASRLSAYPNKGIVGLPEFCETTRARKHKLEKLTDMVQKSQHLVILTGAGISTSAGIPDFRGPKGIWTLEKKKQQEQKRQQQQQQQIKGKRKRGRPRKRKRTDEEEEEENKAADNDVVGNEQTSSDKSSSNGTETTSTESTNSSSEEAHASMDFSKAEPTMTHRAITKLASMGKLKYCITQNVDGLHRRSGLSRSFHCAVHGCAFTEQCENCGLEYFRDFDVGGMSFQPTGRTCEECNGGNLVDTLLDWEDALPEADFQRAELECDKADLVLCLGTSLRIEPAGNLPLRAKKFVIVNKQKTAKDDFASLIIHESVDEVMEHLLDELGYDEGWKDIGEQPPIQRQWRAALRADKGEGG